MKAYPSVYHPPPVLIVTGMSGAGRSTVANILEDLGYLVVDNLPPDLIPAVLSRHEVAEHHGRLAVVVDARLQQPVDAVRSALIHLERSGIESLVLFLDADSDILVQRYEENRRPHPLREQGLSGAINRERELLAGLRELADVVIDTSELNIHQLQERVTTHFSHGPPHRPMRVSVSSFGFKHGTPRDVDMLFDVRFLPNPHWEASLRDLTGLDTPVEEYVMQTEDANRFVDQVEELMGFLVPRYRREGKSYLSVGVGCTGGRHRSVVISEQIGKKLEQQGVAVVVEHRDINRDH